MRDRFEQLLNGFSALVARSEPTAVLPVGRIDALLTGYHAAAEEHRRRQVLVADDFNLLDVLQLTGKEVRHSMVLAWLLDHDMRKYGTHAQGARGFRLFLAEFGLPLDYADGWYWVRREVAGDESIVDVEVGCRGRFLLHIENKIWSREGADQTDREWADVRRRARALDVNPPHIRALYLTPFGTDPANPNFRAVSWKGVVRVLERFAASAKPPDVALFARHYARGLQRFILRQATSEDDDGETTPE
jgi:hypothetical protein